MFHEALQEGTIQKTFFSQNEVIGWADIGTSSRPVTGLVIGREIRGVVTNDKGEVKMRVQTYVKPTGNIEPLDRVCGSKRHWGWSGPEFEITDDFSPEYAMTLSYSPTSAQRLTENETLNILPLVSSVPLLTECSLNTQVPQKVPPSHQSLPF